MYTQKPDEVKTDGAETPIVRNRDTAAAPARIIQESGRASGAEPEVRRCPLPPPLSARRTLAAALQAAREMATKNRPDGADAALGEIACARVEAGDVAGARQSAAGIRDAAEHIRVVCRLVDLLAEHNKPTKTPPKPVGEAETR